MIRVKFRNFHILHAVCWIRKYFVKSADSKNFSLANDLTIFLLKYIHICMHINSSLYKCHDFAFLSIEITIRLENKLSAFLSKMNSNLFAKIVLRLDFNCDSNLRVKATMTSARILYLF